MPPTGQCHTSSGQNVSPAPPWSVPLESGQHLRHIFAGHCADHTTSCLILELCTSQHWPVCSRGLCVCMVEGGGGEADDRWSAQIHAPVSSAGPPGRSAPPESKPSAASFAEWDSSPKCGPLLGGPWIITWI